MNLFRFSLWDYEGDSGWLFLHPEEKTEADFKEDILRVLRIHGSEYLDEAEKEHIWAGTTEWTETAIKHLPEYGYIPAKVTHFSLQDHSIINLHSRAEGWKEAVGEQLFNRADQWNKTLKEKTFEDDED